MRSRIVEAFSRAQIERAAVVNGEPRYEKLKGGPGVRYPRLIVKPVRCKDSLSGYHGLDIVQ